MEEVEEKWALLQVMDDACARENTCIILWVGMSGARAKH